MFYHQLVMIYLIDKSDEQKARRHWGDHYAFALFIEKNTAENSTILFTDHKLLARSRYTLYPRELLEELNLSNIVNVVRENSNITHVVIYRQHFEDMNNPIFSTKLFFKEDEYILVVNRK